MKNICMYKKMTKIIQGIFKILSKGKRNPRETKILDWNLVNMKKQLSLLCMLLSLTINDKCYAPPPPSFLGPHQPK